MAVQVKRPTDSATRGLLAPRAEMCASRRDIEIDVFNHVLNRSQDALLPCHACTWLSIRSIIHPCWRLCCSPISIGFRDRPT